MQTFSFFAFGGMAALLCGPVLGQQAVELSQRPSGGGAALVQTAGAKLPATVRWLSPDPEGILDVATTYVLRVETSHTDSPVTFSLLGGPGILTGDELVPATAGKVALEVRQAGNATFLPLDAQVVFTAAQRQPTTFTWLTPVANEVLQIEKPYALQIRTSHSDLPVSFELLGGPATLTSNVLTVTNGGFAPLKIAQAGNALYLALATNWNFSAGTHPNVTWLAPTNLTLAMGHTYKLEVQTSQNETPVLFALFDGQATLEGDQLTPTGPGPIRVTMSQAGNKTYSIASDLRSFQAVAETQTVSWQAPLEHSLSLNTPFALRAQSSAGMAVSFRVERGPARIDNGNLILTNSGTVSIVAEQPGTTTVLPALARRYFNADEMVLARGSWPGYARPNEGDALQIVGNKVYLAGGRGGLVILDLSSSLLPQRVGSYDTPGYAYGVWVSEGRAYVADSEGGLEIVDVADPTQPFKLGSIATADQAIGIFVTNHLAFVSAWSAGLQIFDVANAALPKLLSTVPTAGNAGAVEVVNGRAYVAAGTGGLEIYDVVNPAKPTLISQFATGGQALGVEVLNDVAYLSVLDVGLVILDVSQPAKPIKLAKYHTPTLYQVRVVGKRAYLAAGPEQLLILDVSNLSLPLLVDRRQVSGQAFDVQVQGDKAYVATELTGLDVMDLTANSGSIINLTGRSLRLQLDGNRAYVADYRAGFKVLDVADADNPRLIGFRPIGGYVEDVALAGRYAYLAKGSGGVQVIDVSDPRNPIQGNSLAVGGYASALRVQGQHAFVAAGNAGLVVLDLSKPEAPVILSTMGSTAAGGFAGILEMAGNTVYMAGYQGAGFQILDVSNPAKPKRIGAYKYYEDSNFEGFFISGRYVYLANQDVGIEVLDISDPTNPTPVGVFDTDGSAMGVEVMGNLAYVADYTNGLLVLDVSDPTMPKLLERFKTPGDAVGFHAIGNTGYILDGEWGVQTVELRPRAPQQIDFRIAGDLLTTDFPALLGAAANSGLPVSYRVLSGPATVLGNQLTITGPGTVIVRVEQAGNDQFLPASLERTLTVTLPGQSIVWLSPTNQFLALGQPQTLRAEASSGLPVHFSVDAGPASISGTTVTVTNTGTLRIVAEQSGSADYKPARFTRTFNVSGFALVGNGSSNTTGVALWPGPQRGAAQAVQVVGHWAYVAAGGLRILDVSQPEQPVEVGSYDPGTAAVAVQVTGHLAYVALGYAGLSVVDVSDPAAPRSIGVYQNFQNQSSILDVSVVGDIACLAGSDGLHILNVKDPTHPVREGLYSMSVQARAVRAVGTLVYVAAGTTGLLIIDVSTPQSPTLLGSYDTPGIATGLFVERSYAYIADQTGGVQMVDISAPARPVGAGSYKTLGSAQSLQVVGARAYIAEGSSGIEIIDIANLASPKRVATFPSEDSARALQIADGFGYIADGKSGLTIFQVKSQNTLQYTATYATAGTGADVQVADGYAFLADSESGLQILDVHDPAHPIQVSNYPTSGDATSVHLVGHTAYIGDYGLEIVDVSQPAAPDYLGGFFDNSSGIEDFVVQGTTAFLAAYSDGLIIVDVTDPQNPQSLGTYVEDNLFAYAVAVQGSYAYLGTSEEVQIIDIHNPAEPIKVGFWPNLGFANSIMLKGAYAYIGNSDGLVVLDIRDPIHPRLASTFATVEVKQLQIDGDLLYLANDYDGFQIVDASDPSRPISLGKFRTVSNASAIQVVGKNVYVACGQRGLQIFELHQGWPQTLTFSPPPELVTTDPALTLTAMASSGLPVSFSIMRGAATVQDGHLLVSAPGELVVRALQAGDSTYLPALVDRTIQVRLRAQQVTWVSPASTILTWNEPYSLSALAESGLPVTYQWKSGPALLQGSTVTVTNLGAVVLTARQVGNAIYAPGEEDLILNAPAFSAHETGSWPGFARGEAYGVRVSGRYAYVAASSGGVMIFDLTDAPNPRRVGSIHLDSPINDVRELRVVGNTAYLLNWTAGLFIVDVTNPALPIELGHLSVGNIVWGLDVVDGIAYLTDYLSLSLVDVRNPRSPQLLGRCPVGTDASGVAVRDGVAFVADGMDGLVIVDVHDPAQPFAIGQFSIAGGAVERVTVVGSKAYLSQSYSGFTIVDISDPGAPREIGHYTAGQVDDLRVVDGVAYVTGYEDVLQIVDLGDPAHPVRMGNLKVPGANVAGVDVAGARAYVAARFSDLLVIDISDPHKPVSVGTAQTDGGVPDVDVMSNTVYVADTSIGLEIIDATDPAKPAPIGTFSQAGGGSGIVAAKDLAYLGGWNLGLTVVNTTDPRNPLALSQLSVPGYVAHPSISGNRILLPTGEKGVQLLDATDPTKPSLLSRIDFGDWTYAADANGPLAVAGTRNGLQILGISDPAHPLQLAALATSSEVYDVVLAGTLAYLANGTAGLRVVDLADPTHPRTMSVIPTGGTAQGVLFRDGVVYVADGANGLSVLDVRDPTSPALIGHVPLSGYSERVRMSGDRIYVAAGSAGLKILDAQIAWPQAITTTLPEHLALRSEPIELIATASSGLPVSISIVSGPARLSGGALELTGLGTVILRLEQAGNDRYLAAAIQQRFEVIAQSSQSVVNAWMAKNYPTVPQEQRGLLADPDSDGVPNVLECLLASNPGAKGSMDGRLPVGHVILRDGQWVWEIAIDWNAELASVLAWQFEMSTALDPNRWEAVSLAHIESSATNALIRLPLLGTAQFLRLRIVGL